MGEVRAGDIKPIHKINKHKYVISVTLFTRKSSHTSLFVHLFINQFMHSYTYSTNVYCIPTNISGSSTVMPMASKEKSVQPEKVGHGKKILKLFKILIFI